MGWIVVQSIYLVEHGYAIPHAMRSLFLNGIQGSREPLPRVPICLRIVPLKFYLITTDIIRDSMDVLMLTIQLPIR